MVCKVFTVSLNSSCHLSSLESLSSPEGHSFPDTLRQKEKRQNEGCYRGLGRGIAAFLLSGLLEKLGELMFIEHFLVRRDKVAAHCRMVGLAAA